MHPFEQANLGKAPFRYVGCFTSTFQACPGAPLQPGSSCDYCGTGISQVCQIRSADGRTFKVGSDCVMKVYAENNVKSAADAALVRQVRRDVNKRKLEAKHARDAARIQTAKAWLDADPALLTDRPHPVASMAKSGRTARDWANWMFDHAGTRGRLEVAKLIETT